jgi:heavy metal translocating P-type ATPase
LETQKQPMEPGVEKREPGTCRLCGAPVGPAGGEFCCGGCERVFQVLSGLEGKAAKKLGLVPGGAAGGEGRGAAELPRDPAAERKEHYRISGLGCPSCSWAAEKVLSTGKGVREAHVDFFSSTAVVSYDMRLTSPESIGERLRPFGYELSSLRDETKSSISRQAALRFTVCAVITANLMTISSLRYFESLGWLDDAPDFLLWVELALALPVLWLGWLPMARRAAAGMRRGSLRMDFLIALAAASAFVLSLAAMITGGDDIYFETCAGLVTIAMLSSMMEAKLREKAFADLAPMLKMPVMKVRKVGEDGCFSYDSIHSVRPGETVAFMADELVPFDGEAIGDSAYLSEAVLTGEHRPVRKVGGDAVTAGSTVTEGELRMKVLRLYEDTTLYRIASAVSESLRHGETSLRSADRIVTVFSPLVLVVALAAWVIRLAMFGWDCALSAEGWFPSLAVLAVACPCAFSIAGVSATGTLLRMGVLVKEPGQLPVLRKVRRLLFDKTGTLTEGRMGVESIVWRKEPREEMLPLLLEAEKGSSHPVAQAIRSFLHEKKIERSLDREPEVKDLPGRVLERGDGRFTVGSQTLFADLFTPGDANPRHTLVWFGMDGRAEGCLLVTDPIRDDAGSTLKELGRQGLSLEILSGDRQEVSDWVGRELGVENVRGNLTIEEKVRIVKERIKQGPAAFIGDGTNDALAMSASTASVALGGATSEALAASGFVVLHGNTSALSDIFTMGRRTAAVLTGNYVWALVFNATFIPVAAAGRLTPLAAMLLMLLSSTIVLLNSLRLRKARQRVSGPVG